MLNLHGNWAERRMPTRVSVSAYASGFYYHVLLDGDVNRLTKRCSQPSTLLTPIDFMHALDFKVLGG